MSSALDVTKELCNNLTIEKHGNKLHTVLPPKRVHLTRLDRFYATRLYTSYTYSYSTQTNITTLHLQNIQHSIHQIS